MHTVTTIGLDIAKSVFQVHCVDVTGQVGLMKTQMSCLGGRKHLPRSITKIGMEDQHGGTCFSFSDRRLGRNCHRVWPHCSRHLDCNRCHRFCSRHRVEHYVLKCLDCHQLSYSKLCAPARAFLFAHQTRWATDHYRRTRLRGNGAIAKSSTLLNLSVWSHFPTPAKGQVVRSVGTSRAKRSSLWAYQWSDSF